MPGWSYQALNIGSLSIKNHASYQMPKSLYIKKIHSEYWGSFCYEDGLDEANLSTQEDNLKYLRDSDQKFLENYTVGIDRGVARPVQAGADVFDLTEEW